ARKALRVRWPARRAIRRGRGHSPRRGHPLRAAGPPHRRPGGARGPGGRDRRQQMGPRHRPGGAARPSEGIVRASAAAAARRAPRDRQRQDGTGPRPAPRRRRQGARGLEPPHPDRAAQPLAHGHDRGASAAGPWRAPDQDALHDPGEDAAPRLRRHVHPPRGRRDELRALPRQRVAQRLRPRRHADSPDATGPVGEEPVQGSQEGQYHLADKAPQGPGPGRRVV
ncbi:MAG: GTP-binding protein EngA, partial [uncultured Rubellimicrobium sp.]